jgi:hypothetical protein
MDAMLPAQRETHNGSVIRMDAVVVNGQFAAYVRLGDAAVPAAILIA